MNRDRLGVQWRQSRGEAVHQWGKMTNDAFTAIAGKDKARGARLQQKYRIAKVEAKLEVDEFAIPVSTPGVPVR